jgi:predicted Zn-dependent protease
VELEAVLKLEPSHAGAANNLAWLKAEAGDVKGALPLAQAAHTAEPRNPQYADTYAYVLAKAGQREEAARVLRAAQAASPDDATLAARLKEVTASR